MRWRKKTKEDKTPQPDESRVISIFLIFPTCINDEWRWLERARIRQRYVESKLIETTGIFGGPSYYSSGGFWLDEEFVD